MGEERRGGKERRGDERRIEERRVLSKKHASIPPGPSLDTNLINVVIFTHTVGVIVHHRNTKWPCIKDHVLSLNEPER